MTQLALLLDPLRDDLRPAEVEAVEARIADDDDRRARHALEASGCRCSKPSPFGPDCLKCGRTIR